MLAGCALPSPPPRPLVYDFGPGVLVATATSAAPPALLIADIQTPSALDSTALLYRQGFGNEQQLKAYTLARWSMPPAQLLRQRLRAQLSQHYTLLYPGELIQVGTTRAPVLSLRLELEEFSHWFERPDYSLGWVRLHATLAQASPSGDRVLAQRMFQVQRPAPTPDAPGAVHALSEASAAVVAELGAWVGQQ